MVDDGRMDDRSEKEELTFLFSIKRKNESCKVNLVNEGISEAEISIILQEFSRAFRKRFNEKLSE